MTATASPYRFVGAHSIIHDLVELKEFGQPVLLTDEQAETALAGGCILVPEADFFNIFSQAEVKASAFPKFPGQWLNASAELREKRARALKIGVELHYAAEERAKQREADRIANLSTTPTQEEAAAE